MNLIIKLKNKYERRINSFLNTYYKNRLRKESEPEIKLLGCFRSGTNFIKTVLENNYYCNVITNIGGWKHDYYSDINMNHYPYDYYIITMKNPYSSLASWYKYYYNNGNNIKADRRWPEFLHNRFIIFNKFSNLPIEYRFANPIDYWNNKNWHYYSLANLMNNAIFVKYEDLSEGIELICDEIQKKLKLKRKSPNTPLLVPKYKVQNMDDRLYKNISSYTTSKVFDSNYYTNSEYMRIFSSDEIEFIDRVLDWELIELLDYKEILDSLKNVNNR